MSPATHLAEFHASDVDDLHAGLAEEAHRHDESDGERNEPMLHYYPVRQRTAFVTEVPPRDEHLHRRPNYAS
ncbi:MULTISPECIES: hypothetical protein [unclassified Dietzia]|uniref:hypothetical protein n=1 Tax=unclassified Dietzia TaxID=2617939 RepID=UPI0012E71BBE|nr:MULTISPECIES: hypothetical protein [unclassified Dietzia]QGW24126.1 hypothetical protein GJR88_01693 [Dietzia sp. DQ12-45-1b]